MTTEGAGKNEPSREGRLSRREALDRYEASGYDLDHHPAHILRRAHQRASLCFQRAMAGEDLSPTQFAALATVLRHGEVSQNHLGRLTAMAPPPSAWWYASCWRKGSSGAAPLGRTSGWP